MHALGLQPQGPTFCLYNAAISSTVFTFRGLGKAALPSAAVVRQRTYCSSNMPSDRVKKQAKAKAAASKAKAKDTAPAAGPDQTSDGEGEGSGMITASASMASLNASIANATVDTGRSCTGVLRSHPQSRDVHVSSFTLLYHGHMLLEDAELELNFGR